MKKTLLFLIFCLSIQYAFSQNQSSTKQPVTEDVEKVKPKKEQITTTVITIDLSTPNPESVKNSNNINKLVVKNRNPLAFKLINGNPFRYRYALNFKKINLFTNETFNPSVLDLKKDPVISGQADTDGDGIPDSLDKNPNTPDAITSDIIIEMQNKLNKELLKLKADVDKYIITISSETKLNIDEFNLEKENFKKLYLLNLDKINEIQNKISELKPANDNVIQKQDENNKILESIRLLIDKMINTKDNIYLLPIDINGDNIDYVEVQLDIYDGNNETPETYKYKIWIRGGVKIDVSGGVFITSLFDDEYYSTDNGNNEKLIHKQDNGEYDFGFGTMVNISLRGGAWARPALNFGALFTSNQKFQMLAGFGLILGKSERLILNAGLSMGRVNVLNDDYLSDGKTPYNLGTDGTIPMNEKFKFGNFFGITYNFNKPKSDKD